MKRDLTKQILHVCNDGEREDVAEKIALGMKYCTWCGKPYVNESLPELEPVKNSDVYDVIENKLVTLYQNQEKIYTAIRLLLKEKNL
jgi:hypothetical protein